MLKTVSASINVSSAEERQLIDIFDCNSTTLNNKLTNISSAALEEYTEMILGNKVFSSGSDILVYRLRLLITNCYKDTLPDEEMVSRIFQTTSTSSRTLLRAATSKYQYELKDIINKTISKLVEDTIVVSAKKGVVLLAINNNSRFFIELLNEKISSLDVTLPSVSLRPHCIGSYEIKLSTYHKLCKEYGLKPKVK